MVYPPELLKEILIRGRVVEISARIENCIKAIIYLASQNTKANLSDKDILINYKDYHYDEKLTEACNLIKKFYPQFAERAISVVGKTKKYISYRNRVTHCSFYWDDPSLKSFTIWDVVNIKEDGKPLQHHAPFVYTIEQHDENVSELKKITLEWLELTQAIADDIGTKIPGFFRSD